MERTTKTKKTKKSSVNPELYFSIFAQSPISTQLLTPDGKTVQVNKAWEQLWELTLDQLENYNMLEDKQLIEEGSMPLIKRGFKGEVVKLPAIKYYPNKTIKTAQSPNYRWTKAHMFPIKDTNNNIILIVLQHEDITQQIEDTNKLIESNLTLQTVINASPLAVYVLNAEGKITLWNNYAEKLFGWKEDEVKGKILPIVQPEKVEEHQELIRKLRSGNAFMRDVVRQKKDGSLIDLIISANPVMDENKYLKAIVAIAADITDRKELERRKDEFIGIASHELKTPVTSIKAYGQVLKRIFEREGNTKAVTQLSKMDAQINKLTDLISDLLDVTKVQTGKLIMQNEKYDFNSLIKDTIDEMQLTTERHYLIPQLDKSKTIVGDKERTGQVLVNLITNAIKYSPSSDKIIISTKVDKTYITTCVEDFGVGIPVDKQDRVFDQFFRVSGDKQHTFPGLGLGLYISSEIIKRQGGKIWVKSIEGKGSKFCFRIPFTNKVNEDSATAIDEEAIKHE